ncbi:MAG: hypothetical protein J2P56_06350 [Verrucomicrobia bacterium]|nr:hypothetical protein [Verrucomicrobiota bacterium]
MKRAKSIFAFTFLILLWLIAAGIEYDLVMHLGVLYSFCVSIFALSVLMWGLLRAPEGYENQDGFHIGVLADAAFL